MLRNQGLAAVASRQMGMIPSGAVSVLVSLPIRGTILEFEHLKHHAFSRNPRRLPRAKF